MTSISQIRPAVTFGARLCAFLLLSMMPLAGCQKQDSVAEGPIASQSGEPTVGAPESQAVEPSQSATAQVSGEAAESNGRSVSPAVPTITFEKTTIDFGEVGTDTKQTGQFKFTNTGKAQLKITRVTSCCGVITRGLEEKKEFAPGEGGVLEFDYHTSSYAGPSTTKRLYIYSNDPERNIVTLTIKASTAQRVACRPERLRLFLKQENAGCGDITVRSLDGRSFAIEEIVSTANAITAEFDPDQEATEFVLKPKADMEKLAENLRGQVVVNLTHPECKKVLLLYDVLPEFTVNPPHVTLFSLKANQPVQREVLVLSNYRDEFEIEETVSQKGTVKVLGTKRIGNRCQLRIEVTPPAREGDNTILADTLAVSIKDGGVLYIPFRGWYE